MTTLTVEQLEALAQRARERGVRRATFYQFEDGFLVEVVQTPASLNGTDGPDEYVIREDGSVA